MSEAKKVTYSTDEQIRTLQEIQQRLATLQKEVDAMQLIVGWKCNRCRRYSPSVQMQSVHNVDIGRYCPPCAAIVDEETWS